MEFVGVSNAVFRHFLVMSNELSTPKVLFCPQETNPSRIMATGFYPNPSYGAVVPLKGDFNLSYFIGVDAADTNVTMFLLGDRNITNRSGVVGGLLTLAPGQAAGWSQEMHQGQGYIGFPDGSVRLVSNAGLTEAIAAAGDMTNRLAIP